MVARSRPLPRHARCCACRPPDLTFLDQLGEILGPRGLLTDASDVAPYLTDWRGLRRGAALAVARPVDTGQVAAMVALCAAHGVAMVPQGGNTSLVAGATPPAGGRNLVIALSRMDRIREVDPVDMTITVEAGVTLQAARGAAAGEGCLLPLSISSEGSARIGGVLASNAGGNNTLRYGSARDLTLGIEAVMPDGAVLHGARSLRKDNTGYALRHLLIGSEGTLGIITAAVLRLVPAPEGVEVALCGVASPEAALALFGRLRSGGLAIEAFEYMSGAAMALVLRHVAGAVLPLSAPAPDYALVECSGHASRARLEELLAAALEADLVTDAALAESVGQRAAMWRLREEHAEAQRLAGANVKNDVSVPVSRVPTLIARATAAVAEIVPDARAVPFGHVGDGNVHMNFCQPEGGADSLLARADEIVETVAAIAVELGGSFSAEHGVGRLKRGMLARWRGGAERDTMRRIKAALDPAGLMNPGVLFD